MHIIDPAGRFGDGPIIIAEGYATAASIHQSTKRPVVVAFDAGNLEAVAVSLMEKHPLTSIIIAADDDHATVQNVGFAHGQAAAKLVGGIFAPVKLSSKHKDLGLTDYNDLCRHGSWRQTGESLVREQIETAVKVAGRLETKSIWECASIMEDELGKASSSNERWQVGVAYWKDCRLDWVKSQKDIREEGSADWVEHDVENMERAQYKRLASIKGKPVSDKIVKSRV